jgi:hypothetical protein
VLFLGILLRARQYRIHSNQQDGVLPPSHFLLKSRNQVHDCFDLGSLRQLMNVLFGKIDGLELGMQIAEVSIFMNNAKVESHIAHDLASLVVDLCQEFVAVLLQSFQVVIGLCDIGIDHRRSSRKQHSSYGHGTKTKDEIKRATQNLRRNELVGIQIIAPCFSSKLASLHHFEHL